jgi:hypothetical protein
MTDAASAPTLNDVWNLFLVVADSEPIQLRVLCMLAVLVIVVLVIDGIRANLERAKPQSLHIFREGFEPTRTSSGSARRLAQRPIWLQKVKVTPKKLSPFKPARPAINRLPGGNSGNTAAYQLQHATRDDSATAL